MCTELSQVLRGSTGSQSEERDEILNQKITLCEEEFGQVGAS